MVILAATKGSGGGRRFQPQARGGVDRSPSPHPPEREHHQSGMVDVGSRSHAHHYNANNISMLPLLRLSVHNAVHNVTRSSAILS
jgi:hypothetical protein